MAWIMRKNIAEAVAPMVGWTPETIQEILAANAEVVDPLSRLSPDDPRYIKEGDAPAGLPIRMPAKPWEAVIEKYQEPLPDAVSASIVNDRIKAMVESLEPGVHRFIPTVLIMPDGSRQESWWAMGSGHRVDAVAEEHCVDVYRYSPRPDLWPNQYYYTSNWTRETRIVVYKEKISGMAMWYDWRIQLTFFSEQLGQMMLDEGIRGYSLRPEENLLRSTHVTEV